MQHAQRLESLGLFAGGIAHDFNNLITVIQGHAGLARESRTDPAAVDAHLQRVELAVRSAAELTGQLLDYAGKREHQPDYVDLGGVVDDARVMLTSWWPADVRLDLDIDEGSIVLADRTRLRQVVLNLLQNAAQACIGADAAVAVSLRRDDRNHETVLTVADTGVGIPADTIDRIFDPFFTTKTDGHGLGLSVVHGIIDSIQGVINVTSVPAHGTTFTITLPLAADARSGDPLRSG
jgi:signal transduction histidine kinase